MSFVQTGFLIACAAVAIPVLVHLLSRWQVKQIELGTMRFLREVIHDGAQRRKIRRWLLMMTRMALLALLALLFARPFLRERTRRDGDRLRVVLIDRSASMGMPGKAGRLIDDAVGAAVDSVSDLGSDAIILWAWFDRHVHPLPEGTSRPSAPRAVVGDTNYLAALSWARDRIDAYPEAIADVVLVTDLQQSGLAADPLAIESLAFPQDVPVQVIDVGRPAANNLAVTSVSTPTTRLDTRQDVVLAVTLFNYGTLPFEEVPLTAAAQDGSVTVRQKKSINVPGGQAQEIAFNFGNQLKPGTWQFAVGLDVADDLAADNRRFTAVEVAQPIRVLVIDSGSEEDGVGSESYFLATALEQARRSGESFDPEDTESNHRSRFHADVVYLGDAAPRVLDVTVNPLVVVADAGAVSHAMIDQLESYVRQGGKALVFAGDGEGSDPSQLWQQAGLAPGKIQRPQRSGVMPFRIVSVNSEAEMLGPFEDPQHGDLSRLSFHTLLPVDIAESTDVLAWFDHGRPAMTQHRVGKGRVVWFLSSADASWGTWTTSPLYLPLVQQMAADLLNLTGEGPIRFRSIGDEQLIAGSTRSGKKVNTIALEGMGQGTDSLTSFARPGFQRREDILYVVNGRSKESDPTRLELTSFVDHFDLTPTDASSAVVSASVVSEKRNELWPWFAAAVFVLLIAEFSLANRTSA